MEEKDDSEIPVSQLWDAQPENVKRNILFEVGLTTMLLYLQWEELSKEQQDKIETHLNS